MEKLWWFVLILLVIIMFLLLKIKSLFDELKNTIRLNKEANEKDVQILNKELALLNSNIEITNKKIEDCNLRVDNAAKTIKKIDQQTKENKKQIKEKYDDIVELIKQNKIEYDKKLAFFTEIESDSMQLNADLSDDQDLPKDPVETDLRTKLDDEQTNAYSCMNDSNTNMFITGKAGTGKSFLLKYFVKTTSKKVLVLAPTGIAALNANGVTIHSVFGWDNLKSNLDDITNKTLKLKSEKRQVLKNVETIIIDEISMVRSDVFEKIDKILRIINNVDLPFAGKQMLLFGDLFQLPPIADKRETEYLKDVFGSKYFFSSNAYKSGSFEFFELSINHRQKEDTAYFKILNNIREGKILENDLKTLNKRTNYENDELRRVVRLLPRKDDVEKINQKELDEIPAKEYVFNSTVMYKDNDLTFDIEKNLPISETLKLKLGALVMMVTNDENHRWVNGTLAIISKISEKQIMVKINGRDYEVFPSSFTQQESVYEDGKIMYKTVCEVIQYPIVLAYAITIHKSQGMTYRKIACNVSDCFESGQVYVALSRCTSIDGLYLLKKVNKKILGVETEVLNFYKKEKTKAISE